MAGGALGFSSSLGEGHIDGDHRPVPSRAAATSTSSWPWPGRCGTTRARPSSSSRPSGPIPEERMELMADMSLAADRPLNWNLLGSLASEEIYQQQLSASDVAAARGAHVVALALPDMMRMRSSNLLPGLPGWREVLALDGDGRRAAAADPDTRAPLRAGAEKAGDRAMGVLSDFGLMEVADPGSEWVGRSLGRHRRRPGHRRRRRPHRRGPGRRPHPLRGPAVADPVARPDRRGMGGPGRGVEGPPGDARGLRRRGPPRPDVPRQLPDRGAR